MRHRAGDESGMGLVELLVAMLVLAIGIFALVAGFSSGFGAINRAGKTSTAGTLADQQMEAFRGGPYSAIATPALNPIPKPGVDGRSYWMDVDVHPAKICADGFVDPLETCSSNGGPISRQVKIVRVSLLDRRTDADPIPFDQAPLLITEFSTFDQSTG